MQKEKVVQNVSTIHLKIIEIGEDSLFRIIIFLSYNNELPNMINEIKLISS